jgi:hypothetical protein
MNQQNWDKCFTEFKALDRMVQMGLRQCASDRLSQDGFEEIGSSDINHQLFAMWDNAKSWEEAIEIELENGTVI